MTSPEQRKLTKKVTGETQCPGNGVTHAGVVVAFTVFIQSPLWQGMAGEVQVLLGERVHIHP